MTKVIGTETQYNNALERVYDLLQNHPSVNTSEGDELNSLALLIEQYEAIHYPMQSKQ